MLDYCLRYMKQLLLLCLSDATLAGADESAIDAMVGRSITMICALKEVHYFR